MFTTPSGVIFLLQPTKPLCTLPCDGHAFKHLSHHPRPCRILPTVPYCVGFHRSAINDGSGLLLRVQRCCNSITANTHQQRQRHRLYNREIINHNSYRWCLAPRAMPATSLPPQPEARGAATPRRQACYNSSSSRHHSNPWDGYHRLKIPSPCPPLSLLQPPRRLPTPTPSNADRRQKASHPSPLRRFLALTRRMRERRGDII